MRLLFTLLALWTATVCLLIGHGCSPSNVQRQSRSSEALALTVNRTTPELARLQTAECRGVVRRAHARDASRDAARALLDDCWARWDRVILAHDVARIAHDHLASLLDACRARDGGTCGPSVDEASREFNAALAQFRCAVRDAGQADPYGEPIACGDAGH